jgi:hypothetical protein
MIGGVVKLSHDFGGDPFTGGAGVGVENAVSHFDNFTATPIAAVTHRQNFDNFFGGAEHWTAAAGVWQIADGKYLATPAALNQHTVAVLDKADPLPTAFELRATVNSPVLAQGFFSNGLIVFDYQSPTDFKFAGGFFGADEWRIGHWDPQDGMVIDNSIAEPSLETGTDYQLAVRIDGSRAVLGVDGRDKLGHAYVDQRLSEGQVGLATHNAVTTFDDFVGPGVSADGDFAVTAAGGVTWTPEPERVGQLIAVHLQVSDGRSDPEGIDTQNYNIYVHREAGNHDPIIISEPQTEFRRPAAGTEPVGNVSPVGVHLNLDVDQTATKHVSLTRPAIESINPAFPR